MIPNGFGASCSESERPGHKTGNAGVGGARKRDTVLKLVNAQGTKVPMPALVPCVAREVPFFVVSKDLVCLSPEVVLEPPLPSLRYCNRSY